MFFGNSRIILFNPSGEGSSEPLEPERDYSKTRVWYGNNNSVYTDYEINENELGANIFFDEDLGIAVTEPTNLIPNVKDAKKIEIGTNIGSIGVQAFYNCKNLETIIIPSTIEYILTDRFDGCENLTNIIFKGRTLEQVQNITNYDEEKLYPWGISDTSIISVA